MTQHTATTAQIELDENNIFYVGQRVRHVKQTDLVGDIRLITVPIYGGGVTKIAIDFDPMTTNMGILARKVGMSWPVRDGGCFYEVRDIGLPVRFWEVVK